MSGSAGRLWRGVLAALAGRRPGAGAEALLEGIFAASPDMLFVHRVEGPGSFPLETWNATAERIFKAPADEAAGRQLETFIHPSNQALVAGELRACFAEGAPREYLLVAHPDRSHRTWRMQLTPIRDRRRRIVRILGCARDVTELKAAEAAAGQAAALKAEFLANVSHEIRTPLNTIVGFSGLLCERDLPATEARYSRLVNGASHTLLALVGDLLDFSKLEAGAVTLEPGTFQLDRLAHEAVELFEGQALDKGLALELRLDGDPLPPAIGDSGRIRQILVNLVSNAVKFTEAGGVTVTVRRERLGGVAKVALAVADTGIGIAPGHQGRLFQRFTQLDGSDTRKFGGAGLGLAICKRLAEAMDGELTVESEVGRGSTFTLAMTLPLADPSARPPPAPAEPRASRILVVDDVDVNRELVAAFLKSTPHRLSEAASGAAAIEAVQREGFDLVLMDIQMPGLTGVEATRAIRALGGRFGALPILAMTANALPEQVASYLAAGMDGHLPKPLLKGALLAAIEGHAAAPAQADAAASPLDGMPADQAAGLLALFDGQLETRLAGPDEDRDQVRADAHALAGSSAMVGFSALGEACRRLDEACRSGAEYAAELAAARAEIAAARASIAAKRAA